MVACLVCGATADVVLDYAPNAYCRHHFEEMIERRVRKDLRVYQPLDIRRTYTFRDDGSALSALTLRLLKRIFGGRLRLRLDAHVSPGPGVILPLCLEQDVSERFAAFLEGGEVVGVRPLRTVSALDANTLVPGAGLSLDGCLHPLLLALERRQQGMRFGFARVLREMQ